MKKRNNLCRKIANRKLELNKQKISELSGGNMGGIKGGSTIGFCPTITKGKGCLVLVSRRDTCLCMSWEPEVCRLGCD